MVAEVTQELMYEVLRNLQQRFDKVDHSISELRRDMISLRNQVHNVQGDINSLRGPLSRVDDRLDRIDSHLDLLEFSERGQRLLDPVSAISPRRRKIIVDRNRNSFLQARNRVWQGANGHKTACQRTSETDR